MTKNLNLPERIIIQIIDRFLKMVWEFDEWLKFIKRGCSTKKIQDEFTDLPVSRQRKWQLRHPEKAREISKRVKRSLESRDKRRVLNRELMRKKRNSKRRNLKAKSYQEGGGE